ncbi:hypothetical protein BH11PSE11_BH11PSE11_01800 [soil metagenome]
MNSAMHTTILKLHRWTGLSLGLVLVMMAITGASLIFRPQVEPLINESLLSVPACIERLPIDTLLANARAAHPLAKAEFIRIASGAEGADRIPAAMIRYSDRDSVYLNPCDGKVLGQRNRYGGLFGNIEGLHRLQFIEFGGLITGTTALIAGVVLIFGGFFIWWPATVRGLKSAARFDSTLSGPARTLNLHKTIGVYAGLVILASVLTGLPQAFKWYKSGIYTLTGSPAPAKSPKSEAAAGATRLSLEELWLRANAIVPRATEVQLRFPDKPTDSAEFFFIERGAAHPNARTYLYLDAYSGGTLRHVPYASSSVGNKIYFWGLSWHNGLIGGLAGQLFLLAGTLSIPVLAYTGIASYLRRRSRQPAGGRILVKVARKKIEARNICSFELVDAAGRPLPPFAAGAHIEVFLRKGLLRTYSLCNNPAETHRYLISVLRDPKSRGGSRMMHDDVREGDVIEIGAPKNLFPLVHPARRTLLLAGGIGITPILAMAEHLSSTGAEFQLHYCARSIERAAFVERIRQSVFADRVSFHFSDGAPEQLIDIPAVLAHSDPDLHLYVCGPKGFMDVVIDTAQKQGWPDTHVHREYFAGEVQTSAADIAFEVKSARTGKIYAIASDKTVLAALSEQGVDVPRSCEQGVCGTCVTRVLEGRPDHRDMYLSAEERAKNDSFTPCCSRSCSPMLVLDI